MHNILIALLSAILASFRTRFALHVEIVALRHQLNVMRRSIPRPTKLHASDRFLWVLLSLLWPDWRSALILVKPETVIAWHRKGFRLFWTWKSKHGRSGKPGISREIRDLIRTMSKASVLWGAPRIHGELLKLGIEVSQATVAKYIVKHHKPPSQTWRMFLENHVRQMVVSVDFFMVPTVGFRILYVFLVLAHERRRVVHFNVTAHPTAEWTAQQLVQAFPYEGRRGTCSGTVTAFMANPSGCRRRTWKSMKCSWLLGLRGNPLMSSA
jgi:putative transposase